MDNSRTNCQVLFLDDSAILAEAVASTLSRQPGVGCLGLECSDPAQVALQTGAASQPDIVVLDPSQSPLAAGPLRQRLIDRLGPHEAVAFLPADADALAQACLQAEYAAVVSRSRSLKSLAGAIAAVAGGGLFVDGCFGPPCGNTGAPQLRGTDGLSGREREVIVAVAGGGACKDIARELGISPKTVETHKYRAMDKLGLRDRSDVIDHARINRWQS